MIELISLALLAAAAAVVLTPLSWTASSPYGGVEADEQLKRNVHNYSTSATLAHGSVLAFDVTLTDTVALEQYRKLSKGVTTPTSGNAHRIGGILRALNGISTGPDQPCEMIEGGLCQALVRVPANMNLAADVDLCPVLGQPYLAPVTMATAPTTPLKAANPLARTLQGYDNSAGSSAVTKLLWVYVIPYHQPQVRQVNIAFVGAITASGSTTYDTDHQVFARALGPGALLDADLQVLVGGSAGSVTLNVGHSTVAAAPTTTSMFTTPPKLNNDQSEEAYTGSLSAGDGDTDTPGAYSAGTGGSAGVLDTLANRQFTAGELLWYLLVTESTMTGVADARITVELVYY